MKEHSGKTPRTGVGTPDSHAEAGGAKIGGDTGDVGTPRIDIGDSPGGTRGSSGGPEASDVVMPGKRGKGRVDNPASARHRRRTLMPREHWNDVPGDLAGEEAENLPGGFGSYDPDLNPDEMVEDITEGDVIRPASEVNTARDGRGRASYAEAMNTGSTVDPADLLEGEEAHPGAAVGFTGAEKEKRVDWENETTDDAEPGEQDERAA